MRGKSNNRFKLTAKEKGWILYDVGNSAFVLMVSTILPIYFIILRKMLGYLMLIIWHIGDMQHL